MRPTADGIVNASQSLEPDMAYKNQESAFHLTPAGWSTKDIPADARAESWRLSVYQESSWSREQRSWSRVWHSVAWSDAERQKLRQRFPLPA